VIKLCTVRSTYWTLLAAAAGITLREQTHQVAGFPADSE